MELYDIRNLSASAFETAMAFGISTDSFERLAKEINRINDGEIKTLITERDALKSALEKINGFSMSQFASHSALSSACLKVSDEALKGQA